MQRRPPEADPKTGLPMERSSSIERLKAQHRRARIGQSTPLGSLRYNSAGYTSMWDTEPPKDGRSYRCYIQRVEVTGTAPMPIPKARSHTRFPRVGTLKSLSSSRSRSRSKQDQKPKQSQAKAGSRAKVPSLYSAKRLQSVFSRRRFTIHKSTLPPSLAPRYSSQHLSFRHTATFKRLGGVLRTSSLKLSTSLPSITSVRRYISARHEKAPSMTPTPPNQLQLLTEGKQ